MAIECTVRCVATWVLVHNLDVDSWDRVIESIYRTRERATTAHLHMRGHNPPHLFGEYAYPGESDEAIPEVSDRPGIDEPTRVLDRAKC
jgi:hypothetical protein